jgi:hypothetical protein
MPSSTSPLLGLPAEPPPRRARSHLQAALLAAALVLAAAALGTALAGAWIGWGLSAAADRAAALAASAATALQPPAPPFDCFFALGGGAIRSGGLLPDPHTRSPACAPALALYLSSGAYDADVEMATDSAAAYLASIPRPSGASLVVLDIDETALSNRAEWDTGWEVAAAVGAPSLRARLAAAALRGDAPALAPTLRLYRAALAAGFSVAFVTGRSGRPEVRDATVANLAAAGYGRACGEGGALFAVAAPADPPCYSALLMRPPQDGRPASVVKPELRALLLKAATEAAGPAAALVASAGDQFSDLGGAPSPYGAFKLPNPVYFIV